MQTIESQFTIMNFNWRWESVPLIVTWTPSSWLPALVRTSYTAIGIWVSINQTVHLWKGKYFHH